jgi:hypothetical protein
LSEKRRVFRILAANWLKTCQRAGKRERYFLFSGFDQKKIANAGGVPGFLPWSLVT